MFSNEAGNVPSTDRYTSISVTKEVREKVRAQKRGGESYSELLTRLIESPPTENSGM